MRVMGLCVVLVCRRNNFGEGEVAATFLVQMQQQLLKLFGFKANLHSNDVETTTRQWEGEKGSLCNTRNQVQHGTVFSQGVLTPWRANEQPQGSLSCTSRARLGRAGAQILYLF